MRLIDAEAFEEKIENLITRFKALGRKQVAEDYNFVLTVLSTAPTIEAKPVVHCKDCKYNVANRQQDPLDITDYTDIVCDYFMTDGMKADDFCSKGVKIPVISMEDVPKIAKEMEK